MSAFGYWALSISLLGAVITLVVYAAHRHVRLWAVTVSLCLVYVVWYWTPLPFQTRPATHPNDDAAVAICYTAMLLGMATEYLYKRAESAHDRPIFTPITFVLPVLASPIVFIPLLTIAGGVDATGLVSPAQLMVYFVAFQNGFFWRSFFEQRGRMMIT
jgi:hypothetical protein